MNLSVNCKKSVLTQHLLTFQLYLTVVRGSLPRGVYKHAANSQIALMYSLIAHLNSTSYLLCTEVHFGI